MKITICLAALLAVAFGWQTTARATILYSQDFESDDTANWTVNDPAISDVTVDFFYDYSGIGVPNSPSGGSRGLRLTANNNGGIFSGFSVSPTGQSFTGSYRVEFDLWQNYVGPLGPGGSGTTQLSTYGIGTSGTVPIWAGSSPKESVMFAHTLDGGSASDFRVYSSAEPFSHQSGDPVYLAPGGAINGSNAYYAQFGGEAAPAAQLGLFPGQTGVTDAGETAFAWRSVVIDVDSITDTATWSIDGLAIATISLSTLSLGGDNIFFGHSDTNGGSSSDPNRALLNVTLVDNIRVTAVPEPSVLGLAFVGATLGFVRRRRR